MSILVAGWAGDSWAQSNITLIADADTHIRENQPTTGSGGGVLQVRSRPNAESGRQNVTYIRFNLSVLANVPESNAVFSVSCSTNPLSATFTNGDVRVFGLLDMSGNTPQQWADGLTYNSSGLEVPGDEDAETQDLDESRLQFIGDLPESFDPASGETLSISNAVLDAFLSDRFANGGFATLMLVQRDSAEREVYFQHTEGSNSPPILAVVGQLGGGGMDTNPPTVNLVSPINGSTNVAVGSSVTAQFSEPMDEATISSNTFILYDATSNTVPATVSFNGGTLTATLDPSSSLGATSTYTAVVVGGPSGVTDLATNALEADFAWSFTTGEAPEVEPDGPISLDPEADTYLTNDTKDGPGASHGNKDQFEIRYHDVRVRLAYVRYDISAIPASLYDTGTLEGSFRSSSHNAAGTWWVYGVNDDQAGNNWDEATVTYATAAGLDPSTPLVEIGITNATLLGTIILDGDDTPPLRYASNTDDLDLTSFLEADTDGKVTFILTGRDPLNVTNRPGNEYRLDSKEHNEAEEWHTPMTLNFIPPLTITDISVAAGPSVLLSWNGFSTHSYGVERNLDLVVLSNWVALATNIVSNTYTDTAPAAVQAFYRVVDEGERPPTEVFFDDFESGVGDWTVIYGTGHVAGTDWQLGTPMSGPPAANSGTNAWGTNLDNVYTPNADTSLLSPTIDLTSASTATLEFSNYFDTELGVDFCNIYVRDASGAEIVGLESPIATYDDFVVAWQTDSVDLPAGALGQMIRLEFQLTSDGITEYFGWYIDDVLVTELSE